MKQENKNINIFLYKLTANGIKIWLEQGRIKLFVPDDIIFLQEHKDFIARYRKQIVECLQNSGTFAPNYCKLILKSCEPIAKLSFAQERLWFMEKYAEGTYVYNVPLLYELAPEADVDILEKSVCSLIQRHEILRTIIKEDEKGRGYQEVLDMQQKKFETSYINVKNSGGLTQELQKEARRPFNLGEDYVIRMTIYEVNDENKKYLNFVIHHIAFDGWSTDIFLKELEVYYNYHFKQRNGERTELKLGIPRGLPREQGHGGLPRGRSAALPAGLARGSSSVRSQKIKLPGLNIQYQDFAVWQREYLSGDILNKELDYWCGKVTGYEALNLVCDKPRPKEINYAGKNLWFSLGMELSAKLRKTAKELKVSLYSLLLSGYVLLLRVYSNQDDIILGASVANRPYRQLENLIGFFVNTLVLRFKIEEATIKEYIQKIGAEVIEAQTHQELPFEKLVEALNITKDSSRHPIFQITFNMQSFGTDISSQLFKHYNGKCGLHEVAKFDLSTFVDDGADNLQCCMNYATSLYKEETISGYAETYVTILSQLIDFKNKIFDIKYLSAEKYALIINQWNNTYSEYTHHKTIKELFEAQVAKTPNNLAVVFAEQKLTYAELNARANQLAHYIHKVYVEMENQELYADTLIGICIERSLEMVIGILAIIKAGGAYVPIDPYYPEERIKNILDDSKPKIVLVDQATFVKTTNLTAAKQIILDNGAIQQTLAKEAVTNPVTNIHGNNLAYVIYTSGTTGKPKGVMIEHRNVINHMLWMQNEFKFTAEDCFLNKTPYVFDASIWEIFIPLFNGSKLIVAKHSGHKDPEYMWQVMYENKVTVVQFVPTLLFGLLQNGFAIDQLPSLRMLFCGGEPLELDAAWADKQAFKIINLYGPTEATIDITSYTYPLGSIGANPENPSSKTEVLPIGKPVANNAVYVLDANLNAVPIGAIGMLYVGGASLGRGYLNQPQLTQERFIKNPFCNNAEQYIYKTGDLVRWLTDGNLEYIGRNDFQVKVRGFRIELGEIENVLARYIGIKQAVVVVKEDAAINSKYLVGYYVAAEKMAEEEILKYLKERLPEYMVPSILVGLEKLPLTVNGKLDRKALPDAKFITSDNYVEPQNKLEKQICLIWQECLCLERIGIDDDFFRVGGNSILAIQVSYRLSKMLNKHVKVATLFKHRTIKELAAVLYGDEQEIVIPKLAYGKIARLSFAQERLWFIEKYEQGTHIYNVPLLYELATEIDVNILAKSLRSVIQRHEILRTLIKEDSEGQCYQEMLDMEQKEFEVRYKQLNDEKELTQELQKDVQHIFNLSDDYVIRAVIYDVNRPEQLAFPDRALIDSSSLDLRYAPALRPSGRAQETSAGKIVPNNFMPQGAPAGSKRSLWGINEYCEQGCNTAENQNAKSISKYLSIVVHHIAFDGWSAGIFLQELENYYFYWTRDGVSPQLLPIQYKDFAGWQNEYLTGATLAKELAYWHEKISGYETLNLIDDKPRPKEIDYAGKSLQFSLGRDFSAKLRHVAKELKVSLYSLLLSGYVLLLSVYSNQDDIVLGTPVANRPHRQLENLIGFFVNTLVLRFKIDDMLIQEYIKKISAEVIEVQTHQDLPFEKLVDVLNIPKDTSRHPIFQVIFSVQSFGMNTQSQLFKPYSKEHDLYNIAKFDLSMFIDDSSYDLQGSLNYATSLYTEGTIAGYVETYTTILAQLIDFKEKISNIKYLSTAKYELIINQWNKTSRDYPRHKTIQELFEEQVLKTPNNIAAVFSGQKLTYAELNVRANQLAHYLRKTYLVAEGKELIGDTLIGICVERNLEMVIGILAIIKAGGAYVPLDQDYPSERIRYMLDDTGIKFIMVQTPLSSTSFFSDPNNKNNYQLISFTDSSFIKQFPLDNPVNINKPDDLAYAMYTSGSTGKAKGVLIEHRAVVNLAFRPEFVAITSGDTVGQFANYSFDAITFEFWGAFLNGAKLVVVAKDVILSSYGFQDVLSKYKINIAFFTTSLFNHLVENDIADLFQLKAIVFGGEAANVKCVQKLLQSKPAHLRLINGYGPTECTTFSHVCLVSDCYKNSNIIPIGKTLSNKKSYVLDKYMRPVPIGALGELYIGGDGIARGYLGQDALTSARFVSNPFVTSQELVYKTQDMVRWLPDGNLEFIGRNDCQVKIRGHRIELGEIEQTILKIPGIKDCVVNVWEIGGDNNFLDKKIVAYYVPNNNKDVTASALQEYLATCLPNYMLPTYFVKLSRLPLTVNGKIDKKALPKPEVESGSVEYCVPRNKLEKDICDIWAGVLGVAQKKISITDDFFSLGGDSIISARLVSKLRQNLDIAISVKDIFQYRCVKKIYDNVLSAVDKRNTKVVIKTEQNLLHGCVPLLPIQEWFFSKEFKFSWHFNQAFLVKTPVLDISLLQNSIKHLIEFHDNFRLCFKNNNEIGCVQYYETDLTPNTLKVLNIKSLGAAEGTEEFAYKLQQIFTAWQSAFNLEQGNLYSIGYIYGFADNSARIYFALHHLIVDAVSCRILMEDLCDIYHGKPLGEKRSSYRQWAVAIKEYAVKHENEKTYWQNVISGMKNLYDQFEQKDCKINKTQISCILNENGFLGYGTKSTRCDDFELPKASPKGEQQDVASINIKLSREITHQLLTGANRIYNAQINDILLTALGYALFAVTGCHTNNITLEGHGREDVFDDLDITRTSGWFTTMYPVRLTIRDDLASSIIYVKETLRQVPNHGIGYGAIIGYKQDVLPRVSFNYLGQFSNTSNQNNQDWYMVNESCGAMIHEENFDCNLVNINGWVMDDVFEFVIKSKFDKKTTEIFVAEFKEVLQKIANYSFAENIKGNTISDFTDFEPYIAITNFSSSSIPLFMFPPGDGGAESYLNNLVPKLNNRNLLLFNNYYFYLLEKFGVDFTKHVTYEWLANMYICYMKSVQAQGPYNLFGWSFGGVLAFEVARQLVRAGETVANLIIVDAYFNLKKALKTITLCSSNKINTINCKYNPKSCKILNKISCKFIKPIKIPEYEEDNHESYEMHEMAKYYVEKTKFNHLDDFLPQKNITVVPINADHDSWVHCDSEVTKIAQILLEVL